MECVEPIKFPMNTGVKTPVKDEIFKLVVDHKEQWKEETRRRYYEILPCLMKHKGSEWSGVDISYLERLLKSDSVYGVAVGVNSMGIVTILGKIKTYDKELERYTRLTEKDIEWLIPQEYRPETCEQIWRLDDCKSGNFVVFRDKCYKKVNDKLFIKNRVSVMGEVELSRFSLIMQAKFQTFFKGNLDGGDLEDIIAEFMSGYPVIDVGTKFDEMINIFHIENPELAANLSLMKDEANNLLSELNAWLGINSLGVDKASGVSDSESNANTPFVSANSDIYIPGRQEPWDDLCKNLGKPKVEVGYNANLVKELEEIDGKEETAIEEDDL